MAIHGSTDQLSNPNHLAYQNMYSYLVYLLTNPYIYHEKYSQLLDATHDLKNPLNSILMCTSLLDEMIANKLGSETDQYIRIIREPATRLTRMINNMLDVAKIESGMLEIKP